MLKSLIRRRARALVGGDGSAPLEFLQPRGDPGLFGPGSEVWRVHADLLPMMIGGIGALVLQSLHPLALAGVWDHSSFRQDLRGRLARTASFIAATSYGGRAMAEQAIERVRSIHSQVVGHHPDGRSYRADDPQLLYWVHLTECSCFLRCYRAFVDPAMSRARRDRYHAEMARIAQLLGCDAAALRAARIAVTEQQARADMRDYLDQLEFSERSAFVLQLLHDTPLAPGRLALQRLLVQAALAHLPHWAYPLLRRQPPGALQRRALQAAVVALGAPLRWALDDGVAACARRRVAA